MSNLSQWAKVPCIVLPLMVAWPSQLNAQDANITLRHTDFREVLFSDDHTSEGFLVPLSNGKISLIFRLDPGIQGNHVGTNASIVQMTYDPASDEWGPVSMVYNSDAYDDRNIHGGVTNDGRIVVFFRRYDGATTEGRYFIYSDDDGQTWSDLQTSRAMTDLSHIGTGQLFYNPDIDRYAIMGYYERKKMAIFYSNDGSSWDDSNLILEDPSIALTEIAGAWAGNNRVVALLRDDVREHGHPLLQVESYDNGATWSEPIQTNMPRDMHFGAAPQVIYDERRDLLIALTSDRYSRPNAENSLFIYTARPNEIFGNPAGWRLQHELLRPWATDDLRRDRPLNQNLYGYPTIAPLDDNEYLVVFTERAVIEGTEQADLYYFRLIHSR